MYPLQRELSCQVAFFTESLRSTPAHAPLSFSYPGKGLSVWRATGPASSYSIQLQLSCQYVPCMESTGTTQTCAHFSSSHSTRETSARNTLGPPAYAVTSPASQSQQAHIVYSRVITHKIIPSSLEEVTVPPNS